MRIRIFAALVMLALNVWPAAAAVLVTPSDFTGSRSTPASSGIVGLGGYSPTYGGLKVSWEITFDGTSWDYRYTFLDANGTVPKPGISHIIIEVSRFITSENVDDFIFDTHGIVGPQVWTKDSRYPNAGNPGGNNGNPNLPADLYGIKLDAGVTFHFKSTQAPMWGDFYTKSGRGPDGKPTTAWNTGIGTEPAGSTTDFTPWIPVPDTEQTGECTTNADCTDGQFCNGPERCVGGDCQPGTPPCTSPQTCDEVNDRCNNPSECTTNADCTDGLFCNGPETCVGGDCQPGTPPCTGGQTCVESNDTCVECTTNADCTDGLFCNGPETCVGGDCQPGTPPCTGGQTCVESNDTCVECTTNADCTDGLFCNGSETCVGGDCQPGTNPCLPGETCDEPNDTCIPPPTCTTNVDCDNSLYCDGQETCVGNNCQPGTNPCLPGETCDEPTDTCIECATNVDCDNSLYCDGQETCVGNNCQPGTPPCTGGQTCDEPNDTCIPPPTCTTNVDCDNSLYCDGQETCVGNNCQPGTNPCLPGETCDEPNDQCIECATNVDCDNSLYCDGQETCVGNTCQPGTNPCLPGETCDEPNDTCIPPPACTTNVDCDNTLYCDGQETCVGNTCQPGTNPCTGGETCDEVNDDCIPPTPVCGDGIEQGGETCDPPSTKQCDDLGPIGCQFDAECTVGWCDDGCLAEPNCANPNPEKACRLQSCTDLLRDPALIIFDDDGPDYFQMHARVAMPNGTFDATAHEFAITIWNAGGRIWQGRLLPGDLKARPSSSKRFVYRDHDARSGNGERDGIYMVATRFRRINGQMSYQVRVKAYSDFSAATLPTMTIQISGLDFLATNTSDWKQTRRGWSLPLRLFSD